MTRRTVRMTRRTAPRRPGARPVGYSRRRRAAAHPTVRRTLPGAGDKWGGRFQSQQGDCRRQEGGPVCVSAVAAWAAQLRRVCQPGWHRGRSTCGATGRIQGSMGTTIHTQHRTQAVRAVPHLEARPRPGRQLDAAQRGRRGRRRLGRAVLHVRIPPRLPAGPVPLEVAVLHSRERAEEARQRLLAHALRAGGRALRAACRWVAACV
jgi:hypothetical protein